MKPIFRNSMFGFHKEDVYYFISKQSRNYEERIKDLTEENARISSELEEEKMNSLSYAEKSRILSDVEMEFSALFASIEEVLSCGELCDLQNKKIKDAFICMEEKLEKAEAFREKAQKFDRLSGVLASIFTDKKDMGEETASDIDDAFSSEKTGFPENDGIDRLRDAIFALQERCITLKKMIADSKTDE